ncbi:hypothetical protein [Lactobacillus sp. PV012]|uniref:hypothetical protein n=1 Tax=Lactobacillus sp. PV012 TaxID=2594494 RepID=UPI00223FAC97|nr:hypothetical protein [Lactobacillus sp. PV012]QNQ82765.1 hypothetical protein FP433_06815 [Lactobacillus sp. PV012]
MKVYIVCPYTKSGGPRSLHQLGNKLIDRNLDVYMYYGYRGKKIDAKNVLYLDSKAKIASKIEDKSENIIIVPEMDTVWLNNYKNIRKVIWWLSLHFYLNNNIWWRANFWTRFLHQPVFFKYMRYAKAKIKEPHINNVNPDDLPKIDYHLYNCEYVRRYLVKHGVQSSDMSYLCGPIDIDVNDGVKISDKENLIIYNPAKASKYILTKILTYMKKNYPKYKFKPLQGMEHKEVLKNLNKAKVYLDLGYFPGPERMPREAAVNYCNIITSNIGAAANKVDVPIPEKFKFSLKKENVPIICKLIVDMCENYTDYTHYYNKYREKTISQINNFDSDIDTFKNVICSVESRRGKNETV